MIDISRGAGGNRYSRNPVLSAYVLGMQKKRSYENMAITRLLFFKKKSDSSSRTPFQVSEREGFQEGRGKNNKVQRLVLECIYNIRDSLAAK